MPAVIGISAQIALLLLVARLPGGPLLVTLALSLWALRSQQRAIQALAFTWLLVFANSALTQPLPLEYRLVVIVAAATGVHLRTRLPIPEPQRRLVLAVDVFVLFSVLGSFIVSYSLAVSLLKLALLWLTVRTVVIASTDTNDDRRSQNEWWVAFGKVLILASIPLLLLPAGFLRNARGFQGLLNHPQAFGVFLAPWVAFFVGQVVRSPRKLLQPFLWVAVATALLILTGSRTGAAGALVGSAVAVLAHFGSWRYRRLPRGGRGTSAIALTTLVLVASLGVLFLPESGVFPAGEYSWQKGYEGSIWEGFQSSRGFLVERSIAGFSTSPLLGVGFGLTGNPSDMGETTYRLGFPVGASVEKGFAITALLEETGLVGLILFSLLLWGLIRTVARSGDPAVIGLAVAAVATNFGESTILSAGGMGLYIWLMVGLALSWRASSRETVGPVTAVGASLPGKP